MSDTAVTLAKLGLLILSLVIASAAVTSFASGQPVAGALFVFLAGLIAVVFAQLA
jgi:hypothetical protein